MTNEITNMMESTEVIEAVATATEKVSKFKSKKVVVVAGIVLVTAATAYGCVKYVRKKKAKAEAEDFEEASVSEEIEGQDTDEK